MKYLTLVLLASVPMLFTACGGDDPHDSDHSSHAGGDSEPSDQHPKIGMTEHQIRDMYGEPDSVSHSGGGDVRHYWFNKGSAFIPYNYGYSQRTGVFYFDADGHLKDFDYND